MISAAAALAFAVAAQVAPAPPAEATARPLVVHEMEPDLIVGSLRDKDPGEALAIARVHQRFKSLIQIRRDFQRELLQTAP